MGIVGRKQAQEELQRLCDSPRAELAVVYGRRRVGKTFLVREFFGNSFAFYSSGIAGGKAAVQLRSFNLSLAEHGGTHSPASDWWEAFSRLRTLLEAEGVKRDEASGKRVVFIDEMPWLDSPRTDFLAAFERFWNMWGSSQRDLLLIVCGSATSWIVQHLFKNRGGLHNRVTARIHLSPFTLAECERYFEVNGISLTRQQVMETYMTFGGIPYYFDLMHPRLGPTQNVDRLLFARDAQLRDEFDELYRSLFRNATHHIAIVRALATKGIGLTREELVEESGLSNGGTLTTVLSELEACGFVRGYHAYGKKTYGKLYQLIDPFTLFYLRFVEGETDHAYWQKNFAGPRANTWRGYAFELVCLLHEQQVLQALGIQAISTDLSAWRSVASDPGAQIDLVIDRADGIIDLCEAKWSVSEYTISKAFDTNLTTKREAFARETATRKALHTVILTPTGVKRNAYRNNIQAAVTADDLFE